MQYESFIKTIAQIFKKKLKKGKKKNYIILYISNSN